MLLIKGRKIKQTIVSSSFRRLMFISVLLNFHWCRSLPAQLVHETPARSSWRGRGDPQGYQQQKVSHSVIVS
jgi:hypothetical protein